MMEQIWDNPFESLKDTLGQRYVFVHSGIEKVYHLPDGDLEFTDFIYEEDLFTLISWINAKDIKNLHTLQEKHPDYKNRIIIDSGAYSVWNSGASFDVDKYIEFLNADDLMDIIFWAAEADVIPGERGRWATYEETNEAAQASWERYLYMIDKVKWPKKIVPIFHQGEDFKFLEQMLEYTFEDGTHIPYIGISPLTASVNSIRDWYEKVEITIRNSSNPNVLTHNFGMTAFRLMEYYTSFSSDSTVALQNSIYGRTWYQIKNGIPDFIVTSHKSYHSDLHYAYRTKEVQEDFKKCIEDRGKKHNITLENLLDEDCDSSVRLYLNVLGIEEWAKNYSPAKPTLITKTSLW